MQHVIHMCLLIAAGVFAVLLVFASHAILTVPVLAGLGIGCLVAAAFI